MQQELFRHGGRRKGAGRKPVGARPSSGHKTRPEIDDTRVLHVVVRVAAEVRNVRRPAMYKAIRNATIAVAKRGWIRIVHLSIQHNHLHLLVEANDAQALSCGMQVLAILVARGINRALGRRGKIFAFRYHATPIASPRQARNALPYVLCNWRRHREDRAPGRARTALLDPYASGLTLDGWRGIASFARPPDYVPLPVAAPQTWLLAVGWRLHGELEPRAVPG